MSDESKTTIQRHPLNDFADRWELNGDCMRCRKCKRQQQTSWALHDFPHAAGCWNEAGERNPWKSLASLIIAQVSKAKEVTHAI